MKIQICGFYGFGNVGDESILQSIMDELGNNEYIISTSLQYSLFGNYRNIVNREIRLHEDMRTDFDAYILGGGELNWGYGWRQCLAIFSKNIPCMNYAVGYNKMWYYSNKLHSLYYEFLKNFNTITVRDEHSLNLVKEVNSKLGATLTFDPSINLKEEKFDCPKNKILVFPRYEDNCVSNQPQLDWLLNELKNVSEKVALVACAPRNVEGYPIDLELCQYLKGRLKDSMIINVSPFEPRKLKYLVSQSKFIYSGGRYHPLIFAISHDIPFKVSPTVEPYPKIRYLLDMYQKFGRDGLIKLTNQNRKIFFEMMDKQKHNKR